MCYSAEALDNHLTRIQRDHERRSQIEERRIRSDAAQEEAKRKEKALQEEKLRQEKAKAEAEVCLPYSRVSSFSLVSELSGNMFILNGHWGFHFNISLCSSKIYEVNRDFTS